VKDCGTRGSSSNIVADEFRRANENGLELIRRLPLEAFRITQHASAAPRRVYRHCFHAAARMSRRVE
jgi:hypothetical protein